MPPLPEAIILVLAPFAPLFSQRVWRHAQVLLLGAMLDARGTHGDRRLAGDGVGDGAPLHQLPSGLEPGHLVGPPGQSDSVGRAHHAAGAPGGDDRARGGRHGGTPLAAGRSRPKAAIGMRCAPRKKHVIRCFGLKWVVDDALGPGALEPAGVGVAVSHRAVLARRAVPASDGTRPVWIGCGR